MTDTCFLSSPFKYWAPVQLVCKEGIQKSRNTLSLSQPSIRRVNHFRSVFSQCICHHYSEHQSITVQSPTNGSARIENVGDGQSSKYPNRREALPPLPPRHFINLTNGIEALSDLSTLLPATELRFTRIQSSHCESSSYDKLLLSLDSELLFSLACGRSCFIYDFGSRNRRRGVPRSLFLGVEFIKWSVAYLWFSKTEPDLVPEKVLVRGLNTVPFWRDEVMEFRISRDAKKKVRYFAPFARDMAVRKIKLFGVYGRISEIDGVKEAHVKLVRDWVEGQVLDTDVGDAVHEEAMREWREKHRYAIHREELSREELVGLQNWMTRSEDKLDEKDSR